MNKKEIKAALADTKEKLVIWAVIAILGLISESLLPYAFVPYIIIAIFVYWVYLFISLIYLTFLARKKAN
ncbi:Hypothetical protein ADU72_1699 [Pediococcus damnosus]|uniref:Uncharacterized protein n=1 Tax=Pediococcus damnosus TaxID=51663 RepID=A0A0R2H703_9LACO|nr:hypothetical protein [Pediococcus damnosus]AMV59962.1 Hypothetical protein ADU69_0284 [Pediococcus damnosus]AMV62500.1 Hypothetical protein ADU70_1006 [Pediococcus damnosus]AMV64206.1 Hypothetical protein ADU71_0283 [Pediococcus damnosus]AMV67624.1 Hypothetical protein ADU72_1699 [Pediococcus damnosus]AMV69035.1 Hypothetical protein ADU73_0627 [Pediococcus damnosus]